MSSTPSCGGSLPQVGVVDLTHDVPPFDVRAGAAALARAFRYLGPGVVLAVVDPGVGGTPAARRPRGARRSRPRWLVGPDNGLLVPAAEAAGGIERGDDASPSTTDATVPRRRGESATFDGRDLFAPAVAALCSGADPGGLGIPLDPADPGSGGRPRGGGGHVGGRARLLRAEVTWVDRFGNVQLAAAGEAVPVLGPRGRGVGRARVGTTHRWCAGCVRSPTLRPASRGCWWTGTAIWLWSCGKARRQPVLVSVSAPWSSSFGDFRFRSLGTIRWHAR